MTTIAIAIYCYIVAITILMIDMALTMMVHTNNSTENNDCNDKYNIRSSPCASRRSSRASSQSGLCGSEPSAGCHLKGRN